MDAEALVLRENTFDAVLCRHGLMFRADLDRALEGMRQMVAPAGRFAATTWAAPSQVPFLSLSMGMVRLWLWSPPPQPGRSCIFSLADAKAHEHAFTNAGVPDVHSDRESHTYEVDSAED